MLRRRLAWHADRLISGGTARILATLVVSLLVVGAVVTVISAAVGVHSGDSSWAHLWRAILRLLDVSSLQEDESTSARLAGLALVLAGLIGLSLLFAVIITMFQDLVASVRDGRTHLIEGPDAVLLGWSDHIFTMLDEFANGSSGIRTVAILSRERRTTMEARIAAECTDLRRKIVVHCRTGDRTLPGDLELVVTSQAKRVVILAEPDDQTDAAVVKTVFAAMCAGARFTEQTIVAEVSSHDAGVAVRGVTNDAVVIVNSDEVLSLVLVQSFRDQGMGQVFQELFSYRGCELYGHAIPEALVGRPFGEAVGRCSNAIVIGRRQGRRVEVLPSFSATLEEGDVLVTVAHVDEPLVVEEAVGGGDGASPVAPVWSTKRILVVGWNRIFGMGVHHLRGFLDASSHIAVLGNRGSLSAEAAADIAESPGIDDTTIAPSLNTMLKTLRERIEADDLDAVAIIPCRDGVEPPHSDAETLVVLSVVRQAMQATKRNLWVAAELRETRSAQLAELVVPDDIILSDSLTASLMAQIVERPWLDAVLADLLDYRGAALFIHPLETWASLTGRPTLTFGEIVEAALDEGAVALGVRRGREVVLVPPRSTSWSAEELTGVIVVGAGVGWAEGLSRDRVAEIAYRADRSITSV